MTLDPERLADLAATAATLAEQGLDQDDIARDLRRRFEGVTITNSRDDDLLDPPWRETAAFSLHLVDGTGHCWTLTDDPAQATGVVLAWRDDDEAEDAA